MKYKSALVTDLSGSIGGMTASRNRGGGYLRSRVNVVQPQTCRQNTARAIFGELASAFAGLSSGERAAWDNAAEAYSPPVQDFCGDSHPTGQNMFIQQNFLRKQSDAMLGTDLGVITTPPSNLIQLYPVATISPPTMTGTDFTVTLNWIEAPQTSVVVSTYVGIPQNPGVNFYGGPYQAANSTANAGPVPNPNVTFDIDDVDEFNSTYYPLVGMRTPLKFTVIDPAGAYLNSQAFQCLTDPVEEVTTA